MKWKDHIAAGGKQTLTLPIVIFSDETSGNRSKKWNRLESYSMFLASLPRKEISKFSNIHFISASNLVNSADLGKEIATDLKGMSNIKIWIFRRAQQYCRVFPLL
jgi:hypothetical protein